MTRGALAAAVLAGLALGAGPAGAQQPTGSDTELDRLDRPVPISATGGVVAWSRRDPSIAQFRLVLQVDLRTIVAPVRPRPVPFDVDVGRGRGGRVVVTYSRCALEPPARGAPGAPLIPEYARGRGCDVYLYDVATRAESRLGTVSTRGASEVLPSVWGDQVAFARTSRGRSRLFVGSLVAGGRSDGRRGGRSGAPGPVGLDLGRGWLASLWRTPGLQELRVGHADGRSHLAARVTRSGTLLGGASLEDAILFYRSTCAGKASLCPERYWGYRWPTRTRPVEDIFAAEGRDVAASTHGGGNTYALLGTDAGAGITCTETAPCPLIAEAGLAYEKVPRRQPQR